MTTQARLSIHPAREMRLNYLGDGLDHMRCAIGTTCNPRGAK
jgi:hypothetical protein